MSLSDPPTPRKSRPARRRGGTQPAALRDEILMLRSVMRRVMALADEGRPLAELLHILDSLSKASNRLANLLKAERQLDENQDVAEALNEALAEVIRELGERSQYTSG